MFLLAIKYHCFKLLDVINGKPFIFSAPSMEVTLVFTDAEINHARWPSSADFSDSS